jgi:hypothetical protein
MAPSSVFRPKTNHTCHKKPNPSRETVPFRTEVGCFDLLEVRDGPVHVVLVVEAEAAQEERPHVLLVHGQDGGGRLRSVHIPTHRTGLRR